MQASEAYYWLLQGERRQRVIQAIAVSKTACQIANELGMRLSCASYVLWELSVYGLVECLNPTARHHRVYGLTNAGAECRRLLGMPERAAVRQASQRNLDWNLYGWALSRHHRAVVLVLDRPMQPCEIKRRARFQNPSIRMSANNVRDVLKRFRERQIVEQIHLEGRHHPGYALTPMGRQIQLQLFRARALSWR